MSRQRGIYHQPVRRSPLNPQERRVVARKSRETLERATLAMLGPGYGPTERALAGSRWTERGNE